MDYTHKLANLHILTKKYLDLPCPGEQSVSVFAENEAQLKAVLEAFGRPDPADITEGTEYLYYKVLRPDLPVIFVHIRKEPWWKKPADRYDGLVSELLEGQENA